MSDVEKQPLLDEFPAEKQAHLEDELQLQIQAAAAVAAKKERQVRTVRTWFYIFYFGIVFWLVGGSQFLNNLLPSRPYVSHRTPFMAALDAYITNVNKLSAELDPASTLSASEPVSAKNLAQAIEKAFLAVPDAESAREALRRYTAVTHIAGSEEDYKSAIQVTSEWAQLLGADFAEDTHVFDAGSSESQDFIKGDWKKKGPFGSPFVKPRAFVDTYYTWINFPINSSLVLYPEPTEGSNEKPEPKYTFKLKEDVLDKDPTSDKGEPQFHGYSKSGSVTGPIVYANQGSKEDFARLHALGVNTTGAIALVRYGDSFRGLKVRAAADAGCVATIIYSDLAEDNNVTEANGYKAYPDGPARNPSSVQRGSVMALSVYAGDPSTPGQPSYENATRLDPESAESLPKIPSIPLSYADAKILFESIKGNGVAPDHKGLGKDWSGAIPGVEYWTGPSKEVAHLTNYQDLKTRKIWNGYAIIPGFIDDEVVVIGNHRDAWTFGAVDPNSGTAAFHEIVAGLGHLVKKGWRPLRTIIVASWDAEEYGLVGSTEFGEDFASWLSKNAAIYHNLDVSVAGPSLMVGASPSLVDLFNGTAKEVPHPDIEGKNMTIEALVDLGSGSDFTVFLQYLGIASSTVGYSQDVGAPIYHYHSNYDSFAWMENFGDPKFTRHLAIARYLGLITLRSASDIFLPINISRYADELQKYLDEASEIVVKSPQTLAGAVDFEPLQEAVDAVKKGARVLEDDKARAKRKIEKLLNHHKGQQHEHRHHHEHHHHEDDHRHKHEKRGGPGVGCAHHKKKRDVRGELREIYELIRSVNKRAQAFERGFISEEGLTGREWYKHLGVAPGRWLGYGATTFPGLKEALALDAGKGAKHEAKRLEKLLLDIAKMLHKGVDEETTK